MFLAVVRHGRYSFYLSQQSCVSLLMRVVLSKDVAFHRPNVYFLDAQCAMREAISFISYHGELHIYAFSNH